MAHPKLAVARSGYGGRGYAIPGRKYDHIDAKGTVTRRQEIYPSVTTVLKRVNKPQLLQWVADQTAAFAIANVDYLMRNDEASNWGYLRWMWRKEPDLEATEIREHYIGVRDDAAELGTNIHEFIDALVGFGVFPKAESREVVEMIEAFEDFLKTHRIKVYHSEFTCVNDRWKVAGTGDGDWEITCLHDNPCLGAEGVLRCLVDLKSSRNTWTEHGYQLAALGSCDWIMVEVPEGTEGAMYASKTEDGKKIESWWIQEKPPVWDRYVLLHIRPADLDTHGERIPPFCEIVDKSEDIDLDQQGFLANLAETRVDYERAQREKARRAEMKANTKESNAA
ncbi:hypothetical protein CMP1-47 [Clavibacter phage CMP1]|uniref:Uncharacterized protein n=1 Tax=Clavibacter phage CMP1 TaxID=686439 RepID=D0U231_9CAUD|nr:exonuclease [Clavibacter phage CMP1]ACY35943.1 hypothetical protein CMP1-47 [Clavibacter phage CMP1]